METFQYDNLTIILNKEGSTSYIKASYPVRYGLYHEIKHPDFLCQFNLNGELKYIKGLQNNWPHPAEWLKRTIGNDWLYYASGGYAYAGIFDLLGEHYLPCLPYASNSFFREDPFCRPAVQEALGFWPKLTRQVELILSKNNTPAQVTTFLKRVVNNSEKKLKTKARSIQSIIKGRISVLPPDTRHVDYEVIPLIIADGCLHNCGFCEVKTGADFNVRSKDDIARQARELKKFYGDDLPNYNALFLGQHDGLAAGIEQIQFAAENAYETLQFDQSLLKNPRLFLFGSVESFLRTDQQSFAAFNMLPYTTFINLGLESADQATLDLLKKPVRSEMVKKAFCKMQEVNREYEHLEVTCNFILADNQPPGHYSKFGELMNDGLASRYSKGAVYFSPLRGFNNRKQILSQFHQFRKKSRLPSYFYLIQRLC